MSGPAPVIDADEIGAANMILTNGGHGCTSTTHIRSIRARGRDPLDA